MKILIDLELDGYDTKEEMKRACLAFVEEQLDFSASFIQILWSEGDPKEKLFKHFFIKE